MSEGALLSSLPSVATPRSKVDFVYDTVKEGILSGRLKPGEPLVQSRIAKSLNVSPIPVMAAMQQLIAEGLVTQEPQAAARIAENEGVFRDKGTVVRVPLVKFLFFRVAEEEFNQLLLILVGAFFLIGAAAVLLGYWYGFYQQSKQYMTPYLPDCEPKMLRLERSKREPPEV